MSNQRKFYSVNQFYELMGTGTISKASIYLQIKKGEIPVAYFGSKPLIPADWAEEFCKSAKLLVD